MNCNGFKYSKHAVVRMAERNIYPEDVVYCLENGEVIAEYDSAKPFPAYLFLVYLKEIPLHVCAARDENGICIIITAYLPDLNDWEIGYRIKRK